MIFSVPVIPFFFLTISDDSDRVFMEQLYIRYYKMMMRMAQSKCTTKEDAEDVVSESLVSLIGKISVLRQLDSNVLEAYIISIIKNNAFIVWRKKKQRNEVDLKDIALETYLGNNNQPEEKLLYECSIQELMSCIVKLKEEDQIYIRMRYFEKRTCREIATTFNVKENYVRTKLTRIRQRLLIMLSEAENSEPDQN